jgi:hypothetical protein
MMPTDTKPWDGDLLGFAQVGATFTKLVQSIDGEAEGSKVISIEAGFGRGKTFFREKWAEELRRAGEVVVEIDARQSDYSGDPVVTFIGALVGALGKDDPHHAKRIFEGTMKWAGIGARVVGGVLLKRAVDGVIDAVDDALTAGEGTSEILDDVVGGAGEGLSKFAKQLIATQLAAEKARKELPAQLEGLRDALTEGKQHKRVVILIDELDRCHPDYAIALLEAMKLVFDEKGYVFVLMVNSDHLERIAAHRFVGWHKDEGDAGREPYLDKFVDMRLKLVAGEEKIGEAARALALELPEPGVPFGDGPEFTVARAAEVAADLALVSGLSMRQIKRVLLRVRLALVTHTETPVDVALLVWLGFRETAKNSGESISMGALLRAQLTPDQPIKWQYLNLRDMDDEEYDKFQRKLHSFLFETCHPLLSLPSDRYRQDLTGNRDFDEDGHKLFFCLAPWYIPEHQAMLDAVHKIAAD